MKRTVVVNPQYSELESFVKSIPQIFSREGVLIRKARNEVKVFDVDGLLVNVKRYCVPPFFVNRVVYTFFRGSKAERAYEYALRLLELDIDTPAPIAYIVEYQGGLLKYSYFVSIQVPHTRCYDEFVASEGAFDSEGEIVLSDFGRYTADLHTKGIYHKDYSPGNILFEMQDGRPQFCLIDINRMEFGELTMERSFKNFNRIYGTPEIYRIISRSYSEARGFDEEETYQEIIKARAKYINKQKMKPKRILSTLLGRS